MADGAEAAGWPNQGEEGENDLSLFLVISLFSVAGIEIFFSIFQCLEVVL